MAWQHIHLVRELDLPHVEKLVLFALASRVDESGECWPSVATLRKDTGLAQRTVQYRLRSLVARGLVSCEERRGATTVLRLHLCEPCASAPQSGVQDGDDKAHTMHPPVHDVHATGASAAPEVTKELPLNRHEEQRAEKLSTTHAAMQGAAKLKVGVHRLQRLGGRHTPASIRKVASCRRRRAPANPIRNTSSVSSQRFNNDDVANGTSDVLALPLYSLH